MGRGVSGVATDGGAGSPSEASLRAVPWESAVGWADAAFLPADWVFPPEDEPFDALDDGVGTSTQVAVDPRAADAGDLGGPVPLDAAGWLQRVVDLQS